MVAPEMLYKMILSRKSTVRSIFVSITARRIAEENISSFWVMDTSNMAQDVNFALERNATSVAIDNFVAGIALFTSEFGRPER